MTTGYYFEMLSHRKEVESLDLFPAKNGIGPNFRLLS